MNVWQTNHRLLIEQREGLMVPKRGTNELTQEQAARLTAAAYVLLQEHQVNKRSPSGSHEDGSVELRGAYSKTKEQVRALEELHEKLPSSASATSPTSIFANVVTLALNVADPLVASQYGKAAFDAVGPLLLNGHDRVN